MQGIHTVGQGMDAVSFMVLTGKCDEIGERQEGWAYIRGSDEDVGLCDLSRVRGKWQNEENDKHWWSKWGKWQFSRRMELKNPNVK